MIAVSTRTFKDRTGKLRGSIKAKLGSGYTSFVEATAKYAGFVEYGTKPHTIAARNGGFLAFQVAGSTVFRRSVKHPGTRATNFMRDARSAEIPAFITTASGFVGDQIRHFNR